MVDQSEIPNPCPLTNQSGGLTGSPGAGPGVNADVIDSRDKNWDLRTVKGVHIFITKQQLRCCAK